MSTYIATPPPLICVIIELSLCIVVCLRFIKHKCGLFFFVYKRILKHFLLTTFASSLRLLAGCPLATITLGLLAHSLATALALGFALFRRLIGTFRFASVKKMIIKYYYI